VRGSGSLPLPRKVLRLRFRIIAIAMERPVAAANCRMQVIAGKQLMAAPFAGLVRMIHDGLAPCHPLALGLLTAVPNPLGRLDNLGKHQDYSEEPRVAAGNDGEGEAQHGDAAPAVTLQRVKACLRRYRVVRRGQVAGKALFRPRPRRK
jgi:hypothetical protein